MKINNLLHIALLFFFIGTMLGCSKNETKFYNDDQANGLAIFSNTDNNLMSCYIQNQPWRTRDRVSGGFINHTTYELLINKQVTSGTADSLIFTWYVNPALNSTLNGDISLVLSVPKNFGYRELSALKGQRIALDSINGYFTFSPILGNTGKGIGNIYFQNIQIDSIGPNNFTGHMSGLIDAKFAGGITMSNGRFDHYITADQIQF
jgi:hypothetical protein